MPGCPIELVDAERVPTLQAFEERRLGGAADTELPFTFIISLARGDDGTIYVVDRSDLEIRAIGPDDELIWTTGGRGEGPGEFLSEPRIGVVGEFIWAIEERSRRLTIFGTDGNLISARSFSGVPVALHEGPWLAGGPPFEGVGFEGVVVPFLMRSDGRFVGRLAYTRAPTVSDAARPEPVSVPIILFDMMDTLADTVGFYPENPREPVSIGTIRVNERTYMLPQAQLDTPLRVWDTNGYYLVDRPVPSSPECGAFRVTRFDFDRAVVFTEEFRYTPRTYSPAHLEALAAGAAGVPGFASVLLDEGAAALIPLGDDLSDPYRLTPEVRNQAAAQIRPRIQLPEFRPPIGDYFLGSSGELWLSRGFEPDAPRQWFVLGREGEMRGTLTIPEEARVMWTGEDSFWLAEIGSLRVQSLVQYRIGEP